MYRSIRDYVSEGAEVSYDQLVNRFGAAEQISAMYVSEMATDELLAQLKIRRKIAGIVAIAVGLLIVLWGGCVATCYLDFQDSLDGFVTVEIIEIEQTNDVGGE